MGEHNMAKNQCKQTEGPDWFIKNYDPQTCDAPDVETELKRLKVLKSYGVLDQEREACYERVTALVSRVFKVPIALIGAIDLGRAWIVGSSTLDFTREVPRQISLCSHLILSKTRLMIVPDLAKDPRFCDNALVTGPTKLRFYAGAQLISPEGFKIGSLCIVDTKPHPEGLSAEQQESLKDLADIVMDLIEKRKPCAKSTLGACASVPETSSEPPAVSSEVATKLIVLRNDLCELVQDPEVHKRITARSKRTLETAYDTTKYLHETLVEKRRRINVELKPEPEALPTVPEPSASSPSSAPQPSASSSFSVPQRVIPLATLEVAGFVRNLKFVMDNFPKKVHLDFSVEPSVPASILTNDLKVFRSTIALLTSACERSARGFIQLRIKMAGDQVVFECEDTSPITDLAECDKLFAEPDEEPEIYAPSCIRVDETTGEIKTGHCCQSAPESASDAYNVHVVTEYMYFLGGKYGSRLRVATQTFSDPGTGCVLWFSIPLIVPSTVPKVESSSAMSTLSEPTSAMSVA